MEKHQDCGRCGHHTQGNRLFCACCGALLDRDGLKRVRLAGAIGVKSSSSPAIEEFKRTGDPEVFDDPRKRGRRSMPV